MKVKNVLIRIAIILFVIVFLFFYMWLLSNLKEERADNVIITTNQSCDNFGINIKEGINNLNEQSEFCNKICNELNKDNLGSKCNFRKEVIKCYCG